MNQYLKAGLIFIGALLLFTIFTHRSEDSNKGLRKKFGQMEIEVQPAEAVQKETPAKKDVSTQQTSISSIELDEKMASFFKEMPRVNELQNNPDMDVHETPELVMIAGRRLGEMREFFLKNPVKPEVEMSFYLKCSQDRDFFDSIRAVCAARISKKYRELTGQKISPLLFDKKIASLKEQITL
ncbi:MAG: hypothetical protein ACXVAX_08140 [Pseudobdellovibrio sp.]